MEKKMKRIKAKRIRGEPCTALIEKPFVLEKLLHEINRFDLSYDAI